MPASGGAAGAAIRAAVAQRAVRIRSACARAPSPMNSVGTTVAQPVEHAARACSRQARLDFAPVHRKRRIHLAAPRIHPGRDHARPVRLAAPTRASASSPETPINGFPSANASPCIVAMPMRRPVNEPGPVATAKTSMSPSATSARVEQRHQIAGQTLARATVGRVAGLARRRRGRHARARSCRPGRRVKGERPSHGITAMRSASQVPAFCMRAAMPHRATVTPAMRQYLDAKRQYRDAIVFFRMGDFYEMFYEDALVASRALDLTLTSRSKDAGGNGIPMCGVPFHAVGRLHRAAGQEGLPGRDLRAGGGSEEGQGLVKREVVRVVSPGTLTDAAYLDAREPAFLMAIVQASGATATYSAPRLSTSRPASSPRPNTRAPTGSRRWPTRSPCCGRARLWCSDDRDADPSSSAVARDRRAAAAGHDDRRRGHFEPEARPARAARSVEDARPRRVRPGRPARPRSRPPAGWSVICATRRRPTSRTCAPSATARAADSLIIDPITLKHLEVVAGSEGGRKDRCCTRSIARSRRWAAGCCAPGCCGRSARSSASAIVSTPSRSSPSARPSAASSARR